MYTQHRSLNRCASWRHWEVAGCGYRPSLERALRAFFSLRLCFALLIASSWVPDWPPDDGTFDTQQQTVQYRSLSRSITGNTHVTQTIQQYNNQTEHQ